MKKLVALGHKHFLTDQNLTKVNWRLTNQCNYRCSYCFMTLLPRYNSDRRTEINTISDQQLSRLINNINTIYSDRTIDLTYTGGEPTLVANFNNIVYETVKNIRNLKYARIHTNLSPSIEFWKEFGIMHKKKMSKILNGTKFDIEASLHTEHINNSKLLSDYIDKILLLESYGVNVNNTIMTNANNKNTAFEYCGIIDSKVKNKTQLKLTVDLITGKSDLILEDGDPVKNKMIFYMYSDGSIEYKTQNEIVETNSNKWIGMVCNIGKTMLDITPEGIGEWCEYSSRCADRPECYDMYNTTIKTKFKPVVCKHKYCIHPGDFQILKLDGIRYQQWIKYGTFIKKR